MNLPLRRYVVQWLRPLLASFTYTARRGLISGMRRKGGFSFIPGRHLSAEETFLRALNLEGLTIYDVGGWEGVYTMFFARAVGPTGRVITFEPNPANRQRISENIVLNHLQNVTLRPVALGSEAGPATLVVEDGIAGEGHVCSMESSGASALNDFTIQIDIETLDREVAVRKLPPPDLVKIDVEGFELNVLQGMTDTLAQRSPRLFVEVHRIPERPENARDIMQFLLERNYAVWHVESGRALENGDLELAHSDHLYCEPFGRDAPSNPLEPAHTGSK